MRAVRARSWHKTQAHRYSNFVQSNRAAGAFGGLSNKFLRTTMFGKLPLQLLGSDSLQTTQSRQNLGWLCYRLCRALSWNINSVHPRKPSQPVMVLTGRHDILTQNVDLVEFEKSTLLWVIKGDLPFLGVCVILPVLFGMSSVTFLMQACSSRLSRTMIRASSSEYFPACGATLCRAGYRCVGKLSLLK